MTVLELRDKLNEQIEQGRNDWLLLIEIDRTVVDIHDVVVSEAYERIYIQN